FSRWRCASQIVSCPTYHGHHLVQLLPVSLTNLWELNDSLRIRSDAGYYRMCLSCGNVSRLRCAKCHSRFCSKGCQRAGWPKHKPECRALGVLLRYNRTDWG
ncbi:hypothetical protein BGY98DRAFT_1030344, partial [Russula aff. rugulosa BPL654]